jgi:ornithine cyclodeaminase/alanine dehydrogenase
MTLYLHDADVCELLPLQDAVTCVEQAFRLLSEGTAVNVVRRRTLVEHVSLNVMWAAAPTLGVLGVKEYPVVRGDVTQGAVLTLLLHSFTTGELLAVVKADRLGQLRTGAASAVATRVLARPDSQTLAVYGCGFQAETQVLAQAAVLPQLRAVRVVGRGAQRRDEFVSRIRRALDIEVTTAHPQEAAESADVIVTATGSAEPVLTGEWIAAGTHINAVGSNVAAKREIDRSLLDRVAVLAVDDRNVAAEECGDLIANDWDQAGVVALGDVLTGRASGRSSHEEITLFESQGLALQDVTCAALVHGRAVQRGMGQQLRDEPTIQS